MASLRHSELNYQLLKVNLRAYMYCTSLQWRHNERHGVLKQLRIDRSLNRLF